MTELEEALAAASAQVPETRLEVIWKAFETDTGQLLSKPPNPSERLAVAEWLRERRALEDESFLIKEPKFRWLAHRTRAEKASSLAQAQCTACELIVEPDGKHVLDLLLPINVEPWTRQSSKDAVKLQRAVTEALRKRGRYAPLATEVICLRMVSVVPTRRGRMDVDNLSKGLLDSLEGILFKNDYQVQCLTTRRVMTTAPTGGFLLAVRAVHPYEADVVADDGKALNILAPRIVP